MVYGDDDPRMTWADWCCTMFFGILIPPLGILCLIHMLKDFIKYMHGNKNSNALRWYDDRTGKSGIIDCCHQERFTN